MTFGLLTSMADLRKCPSCPPLPAPTLARQRWSGVDAHLAPPGVGTAGPSPGPTRRLCRAGVVGLGPWGSRPTLGLRGAVWP